jgi:hypothetical protein
MPHGETMVGGAVWSSLTSKDDLFIRANAFGPIAYTYGDLAHVAKTEIPVVLH